MNGASIECDLLHLQLLSIHRISWILHSLFRNSPQISPLLSSPTYPWALKFFPSMTTLSTEFQSPTNNSFKDFFIAFCRFLRKTTCRLPALEELATDFCFPCYQTYQFYWSVCFISIWFQEDTGLLVFFEVKFDFSSTFTLKQIYYSKYIGMLQLSVDTYCWNTPSKYYFPATEFNLSSARHLQLLPMIWLL